MVYIPFFQGAVTVHCQLASQNKFQELVIRQTDNHSPGAVAGGGGGVVVDYSP